jgi:hypothetical protein
VHTASISTDLGHYWRLYNTAITVWKLNRDPEISQHVTQRWIVTADGYAVLVIYHFSAIFSEVFKTQSSLRGEEQNAPAVGFSNIGAFVPMLTEALTLIKVEFVDMPVKTCLFMCGGFMIQSAQVEKSKG